MRNNAASLSDHHLVPRVLQNTSGRSSAVTLLGRDYNVPFGIAPMGAAAICAYEADAVLARSAAAFGMPMILSAASLMPLERIAREAPNTWYQAYVDGDSPRIEALIDRVAAAGFETFVLTVDCAVPANRETNVRNGFDIPMRPSARVILDSVRHPSWLFGTFLRTYLTHGPLHFENLGAERGPPMLSRQAAANMRGRDRLSWAHLSLIRRRWKGPLVVKGILSPADASLAREAGVDGLIVSNHGGRQLDGVASPLQMLPAIKQAAEGMALMIDGGFRRGSDVLKALALGADFVFVGRPFLYAAAVGGESAVRHAAHLLATEIDRDMALMSLNSLREIDGTYVVRSFAG